MKEQLILKNNEATVEICRNVHSHETYCIISTNPKHKTKNHITFCGNFYDNDLNIKSNITINLSSQNEDKMTDIARHGLTELKTISRKITHLPDNGFFTFTGSDHKVQYKVSIPNKTLIRAFLSKKKSSDKEFTNYGGYVQIVSGGSVTPR